jgi:RNA polymerase sigma-70 factor, ECF subfamily
MYLNLSNSFNEIYTAYFRKSFLYVKSYIHDDMAAEDIVSEALIKLWEQMKREEVDPIRPYLFTILKNKSLDYLKQQTIKRTVHDAVDLALKRELEIRSSTLEASDPNDIFSDEVQRIIEITLDALPEKTRVIFIMSRFGNKRHKEIADFYQISVKGVDYHILQSIKELRSALKDYLPILGVVTFLI